MESASVTRRSSRERVQTPKALEWNQGRSRAVPSDGEDTIEVIEEAPAAPRSKRTEIKILTDLVKSLLEATEGQTSAMEELKREHANQIEVLTRTFTQQIEMLKGQVAEMTEKIESQLSNIQPPRSGSPSYAEVARIPPSSRLSNV